MAYEIRPHVRFSPKATELPRGSEMTRWAESCREQMQQVTRYSITSSARSRTEVGIDTPSALAVFR
ncbi:MAG: hypothetical protein ACRD3W_01830, partial [Terriglobales bacterium]